MVLCEVIPSPSGHKFSDGNFKLEKVVDEIDEEDGIDNVNALERALAWLE